MNLLLTCLYAMALYFAYIAGALQLRAARAASLSPAPGLLAPHARRLPRATLTVALVIAATATLQLLHPILLTTFERDASRIAAGEWWRLGSTLFVQDGGWPSAVFNVIALLFVGSVAEWRWGSARWLVIFFGGALAGELIGLAWQPVGGGNSVANFSLAASVALACLADNPSPLARGAALAAFGADACLLYLKDIHGGAAAAGAIIALALIARQRQRASDAMPHR